MKTKKILLAVLLYLFAFGFAFSIKSNIPDSIASPDSNKDNEAAKAITGYKKWTRVNAKPVLLEASIAAMCAPRMPPKHESPHRDKFIVVYVNEIGRKAMMTEKNPQFPKGAIVVKEKLTAKDSPMPELLTAMVKREKGFNPTSNDWEFVVLSGDAKIIQAQGKLDNCIACHTAKRGSDFVFRNYLSNDDLMKLK